MAPSHTYLVLGATGGTGKHFTQRVLDANHTVKALVRTPSKLPPSLTENPNFQFYQGSITDVSDETITDLVKDTTHVTIFLGDKEAQQKAQINTVFMKRLIPAMRTHGVTRILYQAGGMSKPYGRSLSWPLWILRYVVISAHVGQHVDNESVMAYLVEECKDVEWIVHRAGIHGDGQSKGRLERCVGGGGRPSIATFGDCAEYSVRLVHDDSAVHSMDLSAYGK